MKIICKNKWEHVSDRTLDLVLDHLNTLNDQTPKIRCKDRNGVDPALIFGIETTLFLEGTKLLLESSPTHNEEVETVTISRGVFHRGSHHNHAHGKRGCGWNSSSPPSVQTEDSHVPGPTDGGIEREELIAALNKLSKESTWRVKGFVRLRGAGMYILNWAFGRFELTRLTNSAGTETYGAMQLTVMGERGEVRRAIRKFCVAMDATIDG